MAEPVLSISVSEGDVGALAYWDTLDAFHNNWIHSNGLRTYLPADFVLAGVGTGLDTTTTKLSITDSANQSTANFQTNTITVYDQRTVTADQTSSGGSGATGGNTVLQVIMDPRFTGTRTLGSYTALGIYSVAGIPPAPVTISNWTAIGIHFDNIVGNNMPLMVGFDAHMGAITGLVSEMRTVYGHYHLLFGGAITKATGLYMDDSNAQQTWGFRIGGRGNDSTDAYPSYHMGYIAMGGTLTSGGLGGQFNPSWMLDLREQRKMVRTINVVTHNGTNTIEPAVGGQGSIYPTNIFDFPGEQAATISATGIPGGTTLFLLTSPISSIMSANATASSGAAGVVATITKPTTDQYASTISMLPQYTGAVTITRHNYMFIQQPILAGGALLTDACLFHFNAGAGTHKAVDSGTTKTTPGAVTAWLKANLNGTIHFIPMYSSKTS